MKSKLVLSLIAIVFFIPSLSSFARDFDAFGKNITGASKFSESIIVDRTSEISGRPNILCANATSHYLGAVTEWKQLYMGGCTCPSPEELNKDFNWNVTREVILAEQSVCQVCSEWPIGRGEMGYVDYCAL